MDFPLISIIVPVYKVEQYLIRCVTSIQTQTYPNIEIILVDDGSPDRCGVLCDELAHKDSRIKVIHKSNGGLSSARNAGLDIMQGEYVGFVDSDDWIMPDMYDCIYRRMIQEHAQISCCGIALCDDEKVLHYLNPNMDDRETMSASAALRSLTYNNRITNSVNDKLYASEIFKELRFREGILYEDAQIQPSCLDLAERVTYTSQPLYCYFQAGTSILRSGFSHRRFDMLRWSEERIEMYRKKYPELTAYALAAHCVLCTHIIYQAKNCKDFREQTAALTKQMRSILNKRIFMLLGKRDKVRCGLLYVSRPLFYLVLNAFYARKNR